MAVMNTVWDNSQADLSDLTVDCSASASAVATTNSQPACHNFPPSNPNLSR